MPLLEWVGLFGAESLFWVWVIFWGGAERLEGTFTSGVLIDYLAPRWTAEGIKMFAALIWLFSGVWFVWGCFSPDLRPPVRLIWWH
jgi:hypothetical protein